MAKRKYSRKTHSRSRKGTSLPLPFILVGLLFLCALTVIPELTSLINNPLLLLSGISVIGIIILGLLFGALYWKQRREKRLMRALTLSHVLRMDPYHFENYIAALLSSRRFSVKQTPKRGDFGVDLIATKNKVRWSVQVKHNIASNTGNKAVIEAVGGLPFYKCDRAMVVSTANDFTLAAKEQARRSDCVLIGRTLLSKWIKEFQTSGKTRHQYEYWD